MISKLSAAASNSMHPDVPTDEIVLGYRNLPLLADYLRGWAGIVLAALPLVMMRPSWPVGLGLVCLIGLFAVFLIQTWRRQHSTVILGPAGASRDRPGRAPPRLAASGWPPPALVRVAYQRQRLAGARAARGRRQAGGQLGAGPIRRGGRRGGSGGQRPGHRTRASDARQCRGAASARCLRPAAILSPRAFPAGNSAPHALWQRHARGSRATPPATLAGTGSQSASPAGRHCRCSPWRPAGRRPIGG